MAIMAILKLLIKCFNYNAEPVALLCPLKRRSCRTS